MMHFMKPTPRLLGIALTIALATAAQGALYSFSSDSGQVLPNQANNLTFHHTLGGMGSAIQDLVLTLDFTSATGLNGSALQGRLYLGEGPTPTYVALAPNNPHWSGSTFSCTLDFNQSSAFAGLNPNSTWTLNLWDNNLKYGNNLAGWSLDITAVPEPLNVALCIFGVVVAGAGGARWYFKARKVHRRAYIWPL